MRVYDLVQAAERKALASGGGVGFGAASTGSATPADQGARGSSDEVGRGAGACSAEEC